VVVIERFTILRDGKEHNSQTYCTSNSWVRFFPLNEVFFFLLTIFDCKIKNKQKSNDKSFRIYMNFFTATNALVIPLILSAFVTQFIFKVIAKSFRNTKGVRLNQYPGNRGSK
jgi:hypothetical protein